MKSERPKRTKHKSGAPARKSKSASSRKTAAKSEVGLTIPAILLEGDAPPAPPMSGPGHRYALPPQSGTEAKSPSTNPVFPFPGGEPGELPEGYGSEELSLIARDPHWLYAYWDFTRQQRQKYNALSADRHLILRVHQNALSANPVSEIHVHPESKSWFIPVEQAESTYLAELGYYSGKQRRWNRISVSPPAQTPQASISDDLSLWFETLPLDLPFRYLFDLVKSGSPQTRLLEAIQELRGYPTRPPEPPWAWTTEQERALAELVALEEARRISIGSFEINDLLRRQFQEELYSAGIARLDLASWSGAVSSLFSDFGGGARERAFWFNVNAELLVYGATKPDAVVTLGGRPVPLRPDGTFSFRFALPDGNYPLPAVATSGDGAERRRAELQFSRSSHFHGQVGRQPQDPSLAAPTNTT